MKRITLLAVATATLVTAALALPAAAATATAADSSRTAAAPAKLTNLAHLDFLLDDVPLLTGIAGHTTYRQDTEPSARAPWVYADRQTDGTFSRVGGGPITDAARGWYAQGAFDADDISRAAVVYLRDWKQNGTASSKQSAYELLRSLTYLQTDSGPNAGNVVLWQQSDGTLNPSAIPVELPDPSDSAESFWLARTVWALGEGYAGFRDADPQFAGFLADRLGLALGALDRQSLSKYGTTTTANGVTVPAWLISGSASPTAEAVLGLSAYAAAAPSDQTARTALARYAEGIAKLASGGIGQWPFGALLPEANSPTFWHAWGAMQPAALTAAASVLGDASLQKAATTDLAQFTAQLLASGGPDNGWAGTQQSASGAAQLADGAAQSASGASQLSDGVSQLATGITPLATGADQSASGAASLASGLKTAVAQLPSYDSGERTNLASVASEPVTQKASGTAAFGATSIPLFASVALWLGALASFLVLQAVSRRALLTSRAAGLIALDGFVPAAVLGAVQGVLVAAIMQPALHLDAGHWFGFAGVAVGVGIAFAAVNHGLVALLGGIGRFLSMLVVVITLASGIVSTAPAFFDGALPWLPTSPAITALQGVIASSSDLWRGLGGLLLWAAFGFGLALIAIARKRVVRASQLLPAE